MGRIIGGVDFKDRGHKNVSNILAETKKPYAWSSKESFDFDFFDLIKISSTASSTPCFFENKDLFLFFDGEIIIDDTQLNEEKIANQNDSLVKK